MSRAPRTRDTAGSLNVQRIWNLILVTVLMLLAPWAGIAQRMPQAAMVAAQSCCSADGATADEDGCCALLRQACPNAPLPQSTGPERGCPPCCAERVSDFGLFGPQRREKVAQNVTPVPLSTPATSPRALVAAPRAPIPVARYADQSHRRAVLCVRTT